MLVGAGPGAEEVAQLVVSSAEPSRRSRALEPAHGPVSALDAPVILLDPIVHVLAGPVSNPLAQLGPDRARIAVVAVGRDPVRRGTGDPLRGPEERPRGGHVAALAEHHVYQGAGAVDGEIQVAPAALDLDVGLVNIPAAARLAATAPSQILS